ncbi:MAG: hypothetical protein IID34_11690 [Planctomycetes bacterium]|nr:hypothetical protein [Planctomycetota bacterium]
MPLTTSEQIDRQAVLAILDKKQSGQTITSQERATLKRWERQREEESRWEHYNKIPQKHWREMSGRRTNQLHEQAERYGIPFHRRTICLPEVVKAIYDFLDRNARILARADEADLHSTVTSPALERLREETYKLRRLERLYREDKLVGRDIMHDCLARLAGVLRRAGDRLQRRCGKEAFAIYNEALDGMDREIENSLREHEEGKNGETRR